MNAEPKTSFVGKIIIFLFIAGCFYGAYVLFFQKGSKSSGSATNSSSSNSSTNTNINAVQIGIAYGTEKERWLKTAVQDFALTSDGKNIRVELIPMGSLEGAQAVLAGDKRIVVWSPASSNYKDIFVQDWQVKYGGNPISKEENLALTPMVFVMWEERYQAFIQKYKEVSFQTISSAIQEKGGWDAIAQKPGMGNF
jgi:hypothetical protein